jgi:hypothetical protein
MHDVGRRPHPLVLGVAMLAPYDFSYQHVFLLDRGGMPLVYFEVT